MAAKPTHEELERKINALEETVADARRAQEALKESNERLEASEEIRTDIPIILCTGYNDDISPEKVKKAGIGEFLLKPQSKQDLDRAIRRQLDSTTAST